MTDRIPLDDMTSDQVDQLYDELDRLRAAVTRVRDLAGRIRQGAPWTANDDDIAAHILQALDGGQAPTEPPVHVGGQANAEDCSAYKGTNPDYPFICPGPDTAAADDLTGVWTPHPPIGCLTNQENQS